MRESSKKRRREWRKIKHESQHAEYKRAREKGVKHWGVDRIRKAFFQELVTASNCKPFYGAMLKRKLSTELQDQLAIGFHDVYRFIQGLKKQKKVRNARKSEIPEGYNSNARWLIVCDPEIIVKHRLRK
ncbi:MAG: hypothetical protein R3309_01710 [Reinekea sp.]|nr:hypothetical protein [Reinekea sp.]